MGDYGLVGHKRKVERGETFAEILGVVTASGGPGAEVAWCQPVLDGEFTDEAGVLWELRGDDSPPWKRVEKLLRDPRVRVLHFYGGETRDVLPEERESFAAEIGPYLTGKKGPTRDDYTDYCAGEFKDGQGNLLLTVEQSC